MSGEKIQCAACGATCHTEMEFCINCGSAIDELHAPIDAGGPETSGLVAGEQWVEAEDDVVRSYQSVLDEGLDTVSDVPDETVSVAVDRATAVARAGPPLYNVPGYVIETADGLLRSVALASPGRLEPYVEELLDALESPGGNPELEVQYCPACFRAFHTVTEADSDAECSSCGAALTTAEGHDVTALPMCWCGSPATIGDDHPCTGRGAESYRHSIATHIARLADSGVDTGSALVERLDTTTSSPAMLEAAARTALAAPEQIEPIREPLHDIAFGPDRGTRNLDPDSDGKSSALAKCALLALTAATTEPQSTVTAGPAITNRILNGESTPEDDALVLAEAGTAPSPDAVRERIGSVGSSRPPNATTLVEVLTGTETDYGIEVGLLARETPALVAPFLQRLLEGLLSEDDRIAMLRSVAAYDPSAIRSGRELLTERLSEYPSDTDAFVALSYLATAIEDPEALAPAMIGFLATLPDSTAVTVVHRDCVAESDRFGTERRALARYLSTLGRENDEVDSDRLLAALDLLADDEQSSSNLTTVAWEG